MGFVPDVLRMSWAFLGRKEKLQAGLPESLYIKFTRKEHTSLLAMVLKGKSRNS